MLAGTFAASQVTRYIAETNLERRAVQRLSLYRNSLVGQLERFDYLPYILSKDAELHKLLSGEDQAQRDKINRFLERVNQEAGAAAVFLMDAEGTTVASSNWRSPMSFVGRSYRFRPYFQQALQGKLGRYFAIGATTGLPGGFFAYALTAAERPLGVIVVKVDLEELQAAWTEANENVVVSDANGVIFLSSRRGWRYLSLIPLEKKVQRQLVETRQYGGRSIKTLGQWHEREGEAKKYYEVFNNVETFDVSALPRFLVRSSSIEGFDWRLHILMDLESVRVAVRQSVLVSLLAAALVVAVALYFRQRRAYVRSVEVARDELEERVQQRTEDLEGANAQLRSEIRERERAEEELHRAHAELIQASKLAAMGQMAAVIVHELNQPLDAIRTFSASAEILVANGEREELDDNIKMIRQLTERMEKITGQLRSFARKESGVRQPVLVQRVIERSLLLLESRLRQSGIEVQGSLPGDAMYVLGEEIRLEQVMINLCRNAIDAMRNTPVRKLTIGVTGQNGRVVVEVADSGTGIPEEAMPHLFEPFYSTKCEGDDLGLGLALCYSVVTEYGGSISAHNNPQGGATFVVSLALCNEVVEEAVI